MSKKPRTPNGVVDLPPGTGKTIVHRTKVCEHCGHPYIEPCRTTAQARRCGSRRVKK